MKAARYFLIGLIPGVLAGWFLGFLRLPYIEKNHSFLLGFIACLVLIALIIALLFASNKNSLLLRLIGKDPIGEDPKAAIHTYTSIWILVAAFIVAGGLVTSILIYKQKIFFKAQLGIQDKKILEQTTLIESVRKGNMIFLMSNILDNVEEELKNTGTLSDAVIARIAALSFSFKPYKYLEGGRLSEREFSPERGQLLIALILMKMDSVSFARIKRTTSFASADLKKANLKNADLSGADLSSANLKETDFSDANLRNANLKDADLWGANLNRANLNNADLKRSDLRWASLNGTDLAYASLDGAKMSSAQLINADVHEASIQWADLGGAILNESNLSGVRFLGSKMRKINLDKADLSRADLRMIDLNEANLLGTKLNRVLVDSNWNDKLNEWQLNGVKEIQSNYSVITDSLDQWKHHVYRLSKIEK